MTQIATNMFIMNMSNNLALNFRYSTMVLPPLEFGPFSLIVKIH